MNINDIKILVVDDKPNNLRFLSDILIKQGYKVQRAISGELALKATVASPPDLILLDIMMPGLDGYEVCRRLKANSETCEIPVIFISALQEISDKIVAFKVGGVDYITKPFQAEEVLVRVETHLALQNLQKSLQAQNAQLQQEIAERKRAEEALQQKNQDLANTLNQLQATQRELIQSEKMAALGQLTAGVAHEINSPLGAIRASITNTANALEDSLTQLPKLFQRLSTEQQADFFELVERSLHSYTQLSSREQRQFKRDLTRQLQEKNIDNARRFADLLTGMGIYESVDSFLPILRRSDAEEILQIAYNIARLSLNSKIIMTAVEQASKIVFALKNYSHYDRSGEKQAVQITDGLETVLSLYQNQLKHGIEIIRDYQPLPPIRCYPDELNQVWTNLFHNAVQAMEGQGNLEIRVFEKDGYGVVQVRDSGCGISAEIKERIFDDFFTTKPAGEGSGLGLSIVKKIIDKHQGKIAVESVPGATTFTIFLPINA